MKRLSATIVVLALTAGLAAQTAQQGKPEQKPAAKALNVSGKWTMTLDFSMGTATPALNLKQDGEKISGTYTGRYGTFDLLGSLKDRKIQFSFAMTAEGETVAMSFAGEVAEDGQSMKGTAVLGELGDATWTAAKNKQ